MRGVRFVLVRVDWKDESFPLISLGLEFLEPQKIYNNCSLTRRAESLATPETECLLYATFWFRPILSELIGAAKESADVNRERAPVAP